MLQRLKLTNYRGFDSHSLDLRNPTVIVGYNNAGKSTIVEALRILSILTERLGGLNFRDPPDWTDLPLVEKGLSPSLDGLGIQFRTISNQYKVHPAQIEATFASGESVEILVDSEGRSFARLKDATGAPVRTRGRALKSSFPSMEVLPQLSPLEVQEKILSDDYVRKNFSSPLASRHFRNQLRTEPNAYQKFRRLAEETWPSIQILQLEGARGETGQDLRLLVRDRDFVAEVGLMGHGLQMWLQTMWFLSRCDERATVILDEPDVYMHPDLQRKLIRLVRYMFPQVV